MMTYQPKGKTEIAKDKQELIKGTFSPDEAAEILNYLLAKKINFHEVRSFNKEIRFGQSDHSSENRAEELRQSKQDINDIIKHAKEIGKNLKVSSSIKIELV